MENGVIENALRKVIIDDRLTIIAVYFDAYEIRNNFINEVDALTGIGEGSAIEGILSCTFPRQLDEYEVCHNGFDGINFSLFEDNVSVDIPTFRKYLRIACEVYWKIYPEAQSQLEAYLARLQPPLEEGALPEWKQRRDAGEYSKPISEVEKFESVV